LTNGNILFSKYCFGLRAFAAISRHNCSIIQDDLVVFVCISSVFVYQVCGDIPQDEEVISRAFSAREGLFASERGIVAISGAGWSIIRPLDGGVILSGELDGLSLPDSVAGVEWNSPSVICIGAFSGTFWIIRLDRELSKVVSMSRFCAGGMPLCGRFAFHDQFGAVFAPSVAIVACASTSGVMSMKNPGQMNHLQSVPDPRRPIVIELREGGRIVAVDWMEGSERLLSEVKGRCTAILARSAFENGSGLQIVCGFDNGRVLFFDKGCRSAFEALTLPSPIIAFAQIPLKLRGGWALLAIGANGGCRLLSWSVALSVFDGWPSPLRSVWLLGRAPFFVLGHVDGTYVVHDIARDGPIAVLSEAPRGAVEVWNATPSVTFQAPFVSCQSSVAFAIIDVTDGDIAQHCQQWRPFISRALTRKSDDCGFVILGKGLAPTMFYHPFELTAARMCHTSPFVAGLHCVEHYLLNDSLGLSTAAIDREICVDFLPLFTQLICLEAPAGQKIATRWVIRLLGTLSFTKCQEFGMTILALRDGQEFTPAEQFLLAILVAHHENTVPSEYQASLFQFLIQASSETSPWAVLALAILLQGFAAWIRSLGDHSDAGVDLYQRIIKGILAQRVDFLDDLFCQIACALHETFMAVLPSLTQEFASEKDDPENKLKALFALYTRVALNNQKVFGGFISLALAKAHQTIPLFSELVDEVLESHSLVFRFVAIDKDMCLIGTPDGSVHAFKSGRLFFQEHMIEGAISQVSMSPGLGSGVALSLEAGEVACFRLLQPPKGFFTKKSKHLRWKLELPAGRACTYGVNWDNDKPSIAVVHSFCE
jgi:hypothetical protein